MPWRRCEGGCRLRSDYLDIQALEGLSELGIDFGGLLEEFEWGEIFHRLGGGVDLGFDGEEVVVESFAQEGEESGHTHLEGLLLGGVVDHDGIFGVVAACGVADAHGADQDLLVGDGGDIVAPSLHEVLVAKLLALAFDAYDACVGFLLDGEG